jgi:dual specificity phosphatase 12
LQQEQKTKKQQHKRQQKGERQTDRDRDRSSGHRESKGFQEERGGGMRASASSAADEGKSSLIIAGLRYKVWRAVFGAMKKVREGLYIGNIRDAAAVLSAAEEEEEEEEEKERPSSSPAAAVTHILSLISQEINPLDFKRPASRDPRAAAPPPSSPNKNCKLKQKTVPLLDIHSQNLLDHLEDCLEFIESGRNSGGVVLVHCFAGVSRRQASIDLLPPILYLCISRRG